VVAPSAYEPARCVGEVHIATWAKWFVSRAIWLLTFDILWKHTDEFDILRKHIDDRRGEKSDLVRASWTWIVVIKGANKKEKTMSLLFSEILLIAFVPL
jgi:hypothetical protein